MRARLVHTRTIQTGTPAPELHKKISQQTYEPTKDSKVVIWVVSLVFGSICLLTY